MSRVKTGGGEHWQHKGERVQTPNNMENSGNRRASNQRWPQRHAQGFHRPCQDKTHLTVLRKTGWESAASNVDRRRAARTARSPHTGPSPAVELRRPDGGGSYVRAASLSDLTVARDGVGQPTSGTGHNSPTCNQMLIPAILTPPPTSVDAGPAIRSLHLILPGFCQGAQHTVAHLVAAEGWRAEQAAE